MKNKTEYWVLLYLHDWDEDGKVYPEISRTIYKSFIEAEIGKKEKINPSKYWIRSISI